MSFDIGSALIDVFGFDEIAQEFIAFPALFGLVGNKFIGMIVEKGCEEIGLLVRPDFGLGG